MKRSGNCGRRVMRFVAVTSLLLLTLFLGACQTKRLNLIQPSDVEWLTNSAGEACICLSESGFAKIVGWKLDSE